MNSKKFFVLTSMVVLTAVLTACSHNAAEEVTVDDSTVPAVEEAAPATDAPVVEEAAPAVEEAAPAAEEAAPVAEEAQG